MERLSYIKEFICMSKHEIQEFFTSLSYNGIQIHNTFSFYYYLCTSFKCIKLQVNRQKTSRLSWWSPFHFWDRVCFNSTPFYTPRSSYSRVSNQNLKSQDFKFTNKTPPPLCFHFYFFFLYCCWFVMETYLHFFSIFFLSLSKDTWE